MLQAIISIQISFADCSAIRFFSQYEVYIYMMPLNEMFM